jgi:RHS repeat-associated protein
MMRESNRFTLETIIRFNAALLLSLVTGACLAGQVVTSTSFEYDTTTGALSAMVQNPSDPNLNLRTAYTYDKWGNRLTTTVSSTATGSFAIPSRTVETIKYDTGSVSPVQYTNALGLSTSVKFDPGNLPLYVDELNGLRTQFEYDGYGRVSTQKRPDGNRYEWYYDQCSSSTPCSISSAVLVATKYSLTPSAQENGPKVKTYYDVLNRVVRVETVGFNGTSTILVDTEYDRFGRVYRTSRPYYAGQAIKWTVYSYDVLGRVVDVTGPDGGVVHTAYNGLTTTVTNALNQKRTTTIDGRGLTLQVTDDASGILKYSYDAAGRLVQTTDPKGNTIKMAYDLVGNKLSMTDPDLGTIKYEYDALGQLKKQTDAKNQVVTFQYDLLGRMTSRTEPDLVSSWIYDSCYMGTGRLCSTSADNGYKSTTTYDRYGRVGQTTTTIDADYNTSFTYNADGRLDTLTYPTAVQVKYVYTQLGYISEVRNADSNMLYWKANRMDAEGHLLEQAYGNGVITQQDFDPATGRITAIRAGTNNAVQNLAYTYDKHGNMLTRSDTNQNLWEGFLYDNLNRLTSNSINSTGAGVITQTYGYDSLGNITSRSDAGTYTYGAVNVRPHAVAQITRANGGTRQFTYDASGNLIQEVERDSANNVIAAKGRTETWTSFNMPLKLANASTSTQFVYGTDHQRIKEINPNSTTYFVHPDNSGGLLYEKEYKSASSFEHRHFISAGSAGVVAILKRPYIGAETLVYMHRDNLGSVTAVSDNAGNVIERMAYEPFGKRRTPTGAFDSNGTLLGISTNRGYTNHEELDSLSLIHMNGRVYDPSIGRFISADANVPYQWDLQSYSRFSYARNNPLRYTDPSGFDDEEASGDSGSDDYDPNAKKRKLADDINNRDDDSEKIRQPEKNQCDPGTQCIVVFGFKQTITEGDKAFVWFLAPPAAGAALAVAGPSAGAAIVRVIGKKPSKPQPPEPPPRELSKSELSSLRSLEALIKEHEQKIKDFKENPTVRPGMEHLPQEIIEAQWQRRILHLEREIKAFQGKIERILRKLENEDGKK